MTVVLAGVSGVDYSSARPGGARLAALGAEFVCRYLTEDTFAGKAVTRAEVDDLHGAGLPVVLNGETSPGAALKGSQQGLKDGERFVKALQKLGAPTDIPVPISHDTSGWSNEVPKYFDAVWEQLAAAGWTAKATYGSGKLSQTMQARGNTLDLIWATNATKWPGGVAKDAHLRQGACKLDLTGLAVDGNRAIKSFDAWGTPTIRRTMGTPIRVVDAADTLETYEMLSVNEALVSGSGVWQAQMQGDGNLVVSTLSNPVWNSQTDGNPDASLVMQGDGNLVLQSADYSTVLWATMSVSEPGRPKLVMQNDGNLVIYQGSRALWSIWTGLLI